MATGAKAVAAVYIFSILVFVVIVVLGSGRLTGIAIPTLTGGALIVWGRKSRRPRPKRTAWSIIGDLIIMLAVAFGVTILVVAILRIFFELIEQNYDRWQLLGGAVSLIALLLAGVYYSSTVDKRVLPYRDRLREEVAEIFYLDTWQEVDIQKLQRRYREALLAGSARLVDGIYFLIVSFISIILALLLSNAIVFWNQQGSGRSQLLSAGAAFGIIGVLLWAADRRPTSRSNLGAALLSGVLIALPVSLVTLKASDRSDQEQLHIAVALQRDLRWADLQGVRLDRAYLAARDLSNANLRRAHLVLADFRKAKLTNADFAGANLRKARFGGANLVGVNFSGAALEGANFREADLSNLDLAGWNMQGALFESSTTKWSPNYDPKSHGVSILEPEADLSDRDLAGVDLSRLDLRGANLSDTDLKLADLRGTNLSGADLRGADLRSANLVDADLTGSIAESLSTHWPDDYIPEDHGVVIKES